MRPLVIRKFKSFGSLEITGRRAVDGLDRAVDGLFDITFHYFSHCSRRNDVTEGTVPGNLLRITTHFRIAQTRYCVDISVYHRYIGDGSVYRRSFKDKFVTIRAIGVQIIRNRVYIANALLRLHEQIGDLSRILDA